MDVVLLDLLWFGVDPVATSRISLFHSSFHDFQAGICCLSLLLAQLSGYFILNRHRLINTLHFHFPSFSRFRENAVKIHVLTYNKTSPTPHLPFHV